MLCRIRVARLNCLIGMKSAPVFGPRSSRTSVHMMSKKLIAIIGGKYGRIYFGLRQTRRAVVKMNASGDRFRAGIISGFPNDDVIHAVGIYVTCICNGRGELASCTGAIDCIQNSACLSRKASYVSIGLIGVWMCYCAYSYVLCIVPIKISHVSERTAKQISRRLICQCADDASVCARINFHHS